MVVLGCVQPLRLMKDSSTSKSHFWAGHCPLEHLVTLSSLKRANSHSIHTAEFSQVNNQAFVVRTPELRAVPAIREDAGMFSGVVLTWLLFLGQEGRAGNQARPSTQLANRTEPKTMGFSVLLHIIQLWEI